jgi:hypothetical protein
LEENRWPIGPEIAVTFTPTQGVAAGLGARLAPWAVIDLALLVLCHQVRRFRMNPFGSSDFSVPDDSSSKKTGYGPWGQPFARNFDRVPIGAEKLQEVVVSRFISAR